MNIRICSLFVAALLAFGVNPSASAEENQISFTCRSDAARSPISHFYFEDGHIKREIPGPTTDYGRATVSDTQYTAHKTTEMTPEGSQTESTFTVNLITGRYRLEITKTSNPGHLLVYEGQCQDFKQKNATRTPVLLVLRKNNQPDVFNGDSIFSAPTDLEQDLKDLADAPPDEFSVISNIDFLEVIDDTGRAWRERNIENSEAILESQRLLEKSRRRGNVEVNVGFTSERMQPFDADAANRAMVANVLSAAIRNDFKGWARTCMGGGQGVLYLQTSTPPKTGCQVLFEARCPGGNSHPVRFGQGNYIGGSCMGVGDLIKIGPMPCEAEQVQISMTSATCR